MTSAFLRRILSGGLTGGGLLGVVAFFLPWLTVSCDDTVLGSISPYDRTVGVTLESSAAPLQFKGVQSTAAAPSDAAAPELAAAPAFAALVFGPGIAVALGGLVAVATTLPLRGLGFAGFTVGLANLLAVVIVGLGKRLGFDELGHAGASGFELTATTGFGVWIALAGAVFATSTGLVATLFRAADVPSAAPPRHTRADPRGPK